ncbi:MAG: exodeoxyribonuclease VII small subunit [Rhodospirillales bacterium]|nr:exodeoxyribonuclease VII small subunit [Alphaproteobacteria bacterium]MCB9986036.1 exodeoxyribonuclease VII small subunit [Rhodospirillales bacterium]USO07392.1 MAG: exodeoxyribonuclease VII small subunit [Rhodospirillales bacterium]
MPKTSQDFSDDAVAALSFEDALGALEGIVKSLESGQIPLEDSIQAYERGMKLRAHCEARLKSARLRVEKITLNADGQPDGTTPFNPDQ